MEMTARLPVDCLLYIHWKPSRSPAIYISRSCCCSCSCCSSSYYYIQCYTCVFSRGAQSYQSVDCLLYVHWEPSRSPAIHVPHKHRLCVWPGRLWNAVQSSDVHWFTWAARWGRSTCPLCYPWGLRAGRAAFRSHRRNCQRQTGQRGSKHSNCYLCGIIVN